MYDLQNNHTNEPSMPKKCAYVFMCALLGGALAGGTQLLAYGLTLAYQMPALAANEELQQAFTDQTQQSLPSLIWTNSDSTISLVVSSVFLACINVMTASVDVVGNTKIFPFNLSTLFLTISVISFGFLYATRICGDHIWLKNLETEESYGHCQNFANATRDGVIDPKANQEHYHLITHIQIVSGLIACFTGGLVVTIASSLASKWVDRWWKNQTTNERQSPLLSEGVFSSSHDVEADRQERSSSAHITPFELESTAPSVR